GASPRSSRDDHPEDSRREGFRECQALAAHARGALRRALSPPELRPPPGRRRGLVMGGGDALFLLRPGAKAWLGRDVPQGLGAILAAAAEPARPFQYAVSFQGTAPGAALFCACQDRTTTAIHRVDAGGAVLRIAEIETRTGEPPRLTALAWDPTRHVL